MRPNPRGSTAQIRRHRHIRATAVAIGWSLLLATSIVFGQSLAFQDVTATKGLGAYRGYSGDTHGPGGVFTDLDLDGFPELVLVTGSNDCAPLPDPCDHRVDVFHNQPDGTTGARTFAMTQSLIPLDPSKGGTGVVAGDYDADGDLDLYLLRHPGFPIPTNSTNVAPNELWKNQKIETGELTFTRVASTATDPTGFGDRQLGITTATWWGSRLDLSLAAAWADVDRDGDLDLYVGNHDTSNNFGMPSIDPPGERDTLYLNHGDGTFSDYTLEARATGYETPDGEPCAGAADDLQCYAASNALMFVDLDEDRWPDLVVTNKMNNPDFGADMLYRNLGVDSSGRWRGFENVAYTMTDFGHNPAPAIGTPAQNLVPGTPNAMGIDAGDFDRDGDFDLYVTDANCDVGILGPGLPKCGAGDRNDFFVNQRRVPGSSAVGPLDFLAESDESSDPFSVLAADFSWGTQWLDADNDGDLDLHVATAYPLPDHFYRQDRGKTNQITFTETAGTIGLGQVRDVRGDLAADYDRDGDVDLFAVSAGPDLDSDPNQVVLPPSALFENQLGDGASFLSLALRSHPSLPPADCNGSASGTALCKSSRDALGARVTILADVDGDGSDEMLVREVRSGNGNAASTAALDLEIGLGMVPETLAGGAPNTVPVEIAWPSGRSTSFDATVNRFLTVSEDGFSAPTVIGEVGTKVINHTLTTVVLSRSYTNPVVFALPLSFNGGDPAVARVTDVQNDRFSMAIQEPPNTPSPNHVHETVSWLVLEAGSWRLADGTRLEVGTRVTSSTVTLGQWTTVTLPQPLADHALLPVVLTQVQTRNDPTTWVKTRQRNADVDSFQLGLEPPESFGGQLVAETVGFLAMEPSRGRWSGRAYAAGTTRVLVDHVFTTVDFGQDAGPNARLLAAIASHRSSDPAALRYRDLSGTKVELKTEEDKTLDNETVHAKENVSFLVFEGDGLLHGRVHSNDNPPNAQFTWNCQGLRCTFISTSTDGGQSLPGYGYTWSFGDGDTGNGKTAVHTFERPSPFANPYGVVLTVTDRAGQTSTRQHNVTVGGPTFELIAEYTPSSGVGRSTFVSTSDNPPYFDYFFDPNLGTFEESADGRCFQNRPPNPTAVTVRVRNTQTITACSIRFSHLGGPFACSPDTVTLFNSDDEILLDTDDVTLDPNGCEPLDPLVKRFPFNQVDWVEVSATIGGVTYDRKIRFRKRSEVLHVVDDAAQAGEEVHDTYVKLPPQGQPPQNFGGSGELRVQAEAPDIQFSFLRFDRPEPMDPGATLVSAQLQLSVLAGTSSPVIVHPCGTDTWTENQLDWSNWSSLTGLPCPVGVFFEVAAGWSTGNVQRIDATPHLGTGSQPFFSIGLQNKVITNQVDLRLGSSESVRKPRLVVTYRHD